MLKFPVPVWTVGEDPGPFLTSPYVVTRDPETGVPATVRLVVHASPSKPEAAIALETQPPQSGWKATLLDAREEEIASMPLPQGQTMLAPRLPFGEYLVNIHKGEDRLATFELDIRAR